MLGMTASKSEFGVSALHVSRDVSSSSSSSSRAVTRHTSTLDVDTLVEI